MLSRFHQRYGRTDRQTERFAISISRVSMLTHDNESQPLNHCLRHADLQAVAYSQQTRGSSSSFRTHQDVVTQ